MKTRLILSAILGLLILITAGCQSIKVVQVNAPAYNCLFSTNCIITVNDTVADFTTNLPPYTSNLAASVSGFLQSRTFTGQPGTPEAGLYGYEYRLDLKKLTRADSVTIDSMTINFSPYSSFTYNGQPDNQVWVVTSGGLGSVGPATASVNGAKVTFQFNPPLTLAGAGQETSSYFFGMVSSTLPPTAANGWASFTGSEKLTSGGTNPFNFLMLQVRTP